MTLGKSHPRATVWVDVTTLFTFRYVRIGIPRTLRSILREWQELGYANIRLCRLSRIPGEYVEVEPGQGVEDSGAFVRSPAFGARLWRKLKTGVRQRTKRLLGYLSDEIWNSLREPLLELIHSYRAVTKCLYRSLQDGLLEGLTQRFWPGSCKKASISESDVVVILGGDWDLGNSSEMVWKLKERIGFQLVALIYDVIPFVAPQFMARGQAARVARWQVNTLWSADLVLAISQHGRADLQRFCEFTGSPCPPIEVVRLGDHTGLGAVEDEERPGSELVGDQPFVLAVGTIEVRKNHLLLYQVWAQLAEELGDELPRLVFAGSPGWLAGDMAYLVRTDPRTRDRIVFLQDVNDRQMRWLYRYCLFTMYPSFYEGWGLPVAESLGHGKYCIASNSSSIPEIGGDLVGMHDPRDWKACLELVRQALRDVDFRERREQDIRDRYHGTSWRACALQVQAAVEKHLGPVFQRKEKEDGGATDLASGHLSDPSACSRRSA